LNEGVLLVDSLTGTLPASIASRVIKSHEADDPADKALDLKSIPDINHEDGFP